MQQNAAEDWREDTKSQWLSWEPSSGLLAPTVLFTDRTDNQYPKHSTLTGEKGRQKGLSSCKLVIKTLL